MKIKAPKTWQMVAIFISIILLAVGGGVLYVYLTTGFKTEQVYPLSITIQDQDNTFNSSLEQYEAVDDFDLNIDSPTEKVNNREVTLSFTSGISFTRDEVNGTISDGVIIVPEKITLGQNFTVKLVKQAYSKDGEILTEADIENYEDEIILANKGGVSNLVITTQNKKLPSTTIKIAVDVPVINIGLKIVDASSPELEYNADESGLIKIPEGTNFVVEPVFMPEVSRYQFSDDKNTSLTEKREKHVYYELASATNGITFNYNNGDVYFSALSEVSAFNTINAYLFSDSLTERDFYIANADLEGIALYNEAISTLSSSESAIFSSISHAVVEANVGGFVITTNTQDNPYELTVNKLFRISAGASTLSNVSLGAIVSDIHGNSLSGMIKNVAVRVLSAKTESGEDAPLSDITLKGESAVVIDGLTYVKINSNVKNLNQAYFELSLNGVYDLQLEFVLLVEDEHGRLNIFEEKYVLYFESTESVEEDVSWTSETPDPISMTIIYSGNEAVASQYEKNLNTLTNVPAGNVYQKKVFFVYSSDAGVDLSEYFSTVSSGKGVYVINGENKTLYPLNGSELVAKQAISGVSLVFATVRTDAYGNPILEEDGRYRLIKISNAVTVNVKETLRGFEAGLQIQNEDWLYENETTGRKQYIIPTGSNLQNNISAGNDITLKITLADGDGDVFLSEYNLGNITIYASKNEDGSTKDSAIVIFGQPTITKEANNDVATIQIGLSELNIANEEGENYYFFVEYNNSMQTTSTRADVVTTDVDLFTTGIKVYNQKTKEIKAEGLIGSTFSVDQVLQTSGESSISIQNEAGENVVFNGETGLLKSIQLYDYYGRLFNGNYTLNSSEPTLIIVNNEGEKAITFGAGELANGRVTITSDGVSKSFIVNMTSQGITGINVGGVPSSDLSQASYTFTPDIVGGGATINLKKTGASPDGLLEVLVNGGVYEPSAYYLTFDQAFLSSIDATNFWAMFEVTKEDGAISSNPQSTDKISKIVVKNNFAQDVTLIFNATNDNGTLKFTFKLTIKATATETLNNLNNVAYFTDGTLGVVGREEDETAVYAGFGIDLDEYLSVNNVVWGEVYENEQSFNVEGKKVATVNQGILIFDDVVEKTNIQLTLYALTNNNQYGYYKEINFTVYPNIKIEQKTTQINASAIATTSGYASDNIFDIVRITDQTFDGDTNKGTVELGEEKWTLINAIKFVSLENQMEVEFIEFTQEKNIQRTLVTLIYNYGQTSKDVTLKIYGANGVLIDSADYALILGIDLTNVVGSGKIISGTEKQVLYGGVNVAVIEGEQATINRNIVIEINDKTISAELNTGTNYCYSVTGTSENVDTIAFKFDTINSPILAGDKAFIYLTFKVNGSSEYARWQVPILVSRVGSTFVGYDDENDLQKVFEANEEYYAEVTAGSTYEMKLTGKVIKPKTDGTTTSTNEDPDVSYSYALIGDLANSAFTSFSENGVFKIKNMLAGTEVVVKIKVTITKGSVSLSYDYNLKIVGNLTSIGKVVYPYNGSTAEFVEVENGQSSETINLDSAFGSEAENAGPRFPTGETWGTGTYSVKSVTIDGEEVENFGEGAPFEVELSGSKLTLLTFKNNSDARNVTIVISKTYSNLYNHTFDYTFVVNSSDVEYFVEYSEINNAKLIDGVLEISRGKTEITFSVTTKQRVGDAESNVGSDITTVVTSNFVKGFTIEGHDSDTNPKKIKLTLPEFIGKDSDYEIYFTIAGQKTITLPVFVPSTVGFTWNKEVLTGGTTYEHSDLLAEPSDLPDGAVTITGVSTDDQTGLINTSGSSFSVAPIYNATGLSATVTYNYDYNHDGKTGSGSVSKTFAFEANIDVKSITTADIVGGSTRTIDLSQVLLGAGTEEYSLYGKSYDENYIQGVSINNSTENNSTISIQTKYVPQQTATWVEFKLQYTNGTYSFTTDTIRISFVILPATQPTINYPQPANEKLQYEVIKYGEYTGFFTSTATADFADGARVVWTDEKPKAGDTAGETDNSLNVSINKNESTMNLLDKCSYENGTLTVTKKTGASGIGKITFVLTYKGVSVNYVVYVFDNVISSQTQTTVNQTVEDGQSFELLYADKSSLYDADDKTNIFAKNRLAQLLVSSEASVGTIYKIYDKTDDAELASFRMTESLKTKGTIYVDVGTDVSANTEFVIGGKNDKGEIETYAGVSFVRLASRVEYYYTLSDGSSVLITNQDLIIEESEVLTEEGVSNFEAGQIATFKVQYKIGEDEASAGATTYKDNIDENETSAGEIDYKVKKALDIEVGKEFTAGNQTVITIQTNDGDSYKLVEQAEIRHPSTGELISYDSIKNGEVSLNVQVVDQQELDQTTDREILSLIGSLPESVKYQTANRSDYLTFSPIAKNEDDGGKTVYDFYLFGEGADNNGDYVLLKFDYTVGRFTKSFYLVVKLIPDYTVTIGGTTVATAGTTTEEVASNEISPYNFTPTGDLPLNIATANNSVVSFVRSNWNNVNIANSLTYTLNVMGDGSGYNAESNIGKLNLNPQGSVPQWSGSTESGKYTATPNGSDLIITPSQVVFGQKQYMLEITNEYGFTVHFHFNLLPQQAQNPIIYTGATDTYYVEGEPFDVGVLYDLISVSSHTVGEGDEYDLTMLYDQVPAGASSGNMIVLDNIDTWGSKSDEINSVDGDNVSEASKAIYNNYLTVDTADAPGALSKMTYQYVTVSSVTFQYESEIKQAGGSGGILATANDLKALGEINYYSPQETRRFTVPTMPGWCYGTNDSISVTVRVVLTYSKGGDSETCEVSFVATLSRKVAMNSTGNVVVDGKPFALKDYISVTGYDSDNTAASGNDSDNNNPVSYYDDTLVLTLPASGTATLEVTLNYGTPVTKTYNNENTLRPVTQYISISDLVGRTIQPGSDNVTIEMSGQSENTTLYYAGEAINSAKTISDSDSTASDRQSISNDTIYIEDAGRMLQQDYYVVTKSYVIGVEVASNNFVYYRFNKTYWVTSAFSFFDDGLGIDTIKQIDQGYFDVDGTGNYAVPIGVWADGMTLYQAKTGNESASFEQATSGVSLTSLTFRNIVVESVTSGEFKTLKFTQTFDVSQGNVVIDGVNYSVNTSNGLILTRKFTQNNNNDIVIYGKTYKVSKNETGQFVLTFGDVPIIINSNQDEVEIGQDTFGVAKSDGKLILTRSFTSNNNTITVEGYEYEYSSTNGKIQYQVNAREDEGTINFKGVTYNFKFAEDNTLSITLNGVPCEITADGLIMKSIYFKVSFGDGEISTAYFGEDGTTLYTGPGYKPNNQEYIMVNVYCKASGGPAGSYLESVHGWDKLLGQFRVILI